MSSAAPAYPLPAYGSLRIPVAAFEVLAYLTVVASASLAFVAGWLTVNGAVIITTLLLVGLIALSWIHLGQGRHPVFLFLCTLTLFQGGRLIAHCLGAEPDPMQVELIGLVFKPTQTIQGVALLCLALAAIAIYAPCRLRFGYIPPPDLSLVRKYLPYLYLVFLATLPFQLFKNYRYYEYAQQHGGYLYIYLNHAKLAASVPTLVRLVCVVIPPAFFALFVFETRRKLLVAVAALYFLSASIILLLGQRSTFFMTVLVIWFVARFKSRTRPSLTLLVLALAVLLGIAAFIQTQRADQSVAESPLETLLPGDFIDLQGASLGVTEIAVQYRDIFAPYSFSYLAHELNNAFVASDAPTSQRGYLLPLDVSMFASQRMFGLGYGVGSSYIAESYILGGIAGVVLASLLVGLGLQFLYRMAVRPELLLLAAMLLVDVLWMPRGDLLTWVSAAVRNFAAFFLLAAGWMVYSLLASIKHLPGSDGSVALTPGSQ